MVDGHVGQCADDGGVGVALRRHAEAVIRQTAGLAAHDGIAAFGTPVGAVVLPAVGALVVAAGQVTVIVPAQAALRIRLMGGGTGQGIGIGETVHVQFELRGAEFDLPVVGNGVQQGVHDGLPVRVLAVSVVFGVVPFAPAADEAGLDDEDDVSIFLEVRLDLGDMPERLRRGGVPGLVLLVEAVGIAETEDALGAAVAHGRQVFPDRLEILVGNVPVDKIREVELQQVQRARLLAVDGDIVLGNRLGGSVMDFLGRVKTAFGIGDDLVGSLVVDGFHAGNHVVRSLAASDGQQQERPAGESVSNHGFHGFRVKKHGREPRVCGDPPMAR